MRFHHIVTALFGIAIVVIIAVTGRDMLSASTEALTIKDCNFTDMSITPSTNADEIESTGTMTSTPTDSFNDTVRLKLAIMERDQARILAETYRRMYESEVLLTCEPNLIDPTTVIVGTSDGRIEFTRPRTRDPNIAYNLTDDSVRLLCESGRVCGVIGHEWKRNFDLECKGDSHRADQVFLCSICRKTRIVPFKE